MQFIVWFFLVTITSGCTMSAVIDQLASEAQNSSNLLLGKSAGLCPDTWLSGTTPLDQNRLLLYGDFSQLGECGATGIFIDLDTNQITQTNSSASIKGYIQKVIPDENGGWYVGGSNLEINGIKQKLVARIKADGSLDESFVAFNDIDRKIAEGYSDAVNDMLLVDGKLFLAGNFMVEENPAGGPLDLIDGNSLYPEERRSGLIDGGISAVVSDGNNGWYIAGNFSTYLGNPTYGLIRVDQNGDLVDGFSPKVLGEISHLHYDAPTKKLYLLGEFSFINGQLRVGGAAIDTDTGQLTNWAPIINGVSHKVHTAISNTHGKFYLNGSNIEIGGNLFEYNVAILDLTTGSLIGDIELTHDTGSLFIESLESYDDVLYIGGQFTHINGVARSNAGAIDTANNSITPWNPGPNNMVKAMKVPPLGGSIYLAGDFSNVGGQTRYKLAEVNLSTGSATAFDVGAWSSGFSSIYSLAIGSNSIFVYGSFSSLRGLPRFMFGAYDRTTGAVTNWNPMKSDKIFNGGSLGAKFAINSNAIFVADGSSSIGGTPLGGLAVLNATTGTTLPFNHNRDREVTKTLEVSEDHSLLFVGGKVTGRADRDLEAFNFADLSPASLDFNGGSTFYKDIHDLKIYGNKLYVAGSFQRIGANNLARRSLAVLDITTGNTLPWAPEPDSSVSALEIANGKLFVGGDFKNISSQSRNYFAAYDLSNEALLPLNLPSDSPPFRAINARGDNLYLFGEFNGSAVSIVFNMVTEQFADIANITDSQFKAGAISGNRMLAGGRIQKPKNSVPLSKFAILNLQTREFEAISWDIPDEGFAEGTLPLSNGSLAFRGSFQNSETGIYYGLLIINPESGQVRKVSTNGSVKTFIEKDGVLYLGGEFSEVENETRNYLAAIKLSDNSLLPWNPSADDVVMQLAAVENWIYVGGSFSSINSQGVPYLARIDASSGSPDTWNMNLTNRVFSLSIVGNKLYIAGDFNQINGTYVPGFSILDLTSNTLAPTSFDLFSIRDLYFTSNHIFIFEAAQFKVFDKQTEQLSQAPWVQFVHSKQYFVSETLKMGDFDVLIGEFHETDGSKSSIRVIRTSDGQYRY